MTDTVNTTIVEGAFNRLHIRYRKIDFTDGTLSFCTPPNGLTFDLFTGTDGSIRLWRFVGSVPVEKAGACFEYRKPEYPHTAIGFEVTEEGDLCFYAEQIINATDPQKEHRILKMISGYFEIISTVNFKNAEP